MVVLHLHLPKTGGSTLVQYLREEYGERFHRISARRETNFWNDFQKEPTQYDCISGHLLYPPHPHVSRQCKFITFMREPLERLLSLYHYMTYNSKLGYREELEKIGFEKFVMGQFEGNRVWPELYNFVDNDMVRRIAGVGRGKRPVNEGDFYQAIEHLWNFAPVGLTGEYKESMLRWQKMFEWEERPLGRVLYQPDRMQESEVSQGLKKRIQERHQYDYRLYWAILERDWT